MEDCLFCQIARGQQPSNLRFQDDEVVAFDDIHPEAPTHILVIPKRHIDSLMHADAKDQDILGHMLLTAAQIARQLNLQGYRVVINTGREGGQVIDHLHLHLMGGKDFSQQPGVK